MAKREKTEKVEQATLKSIPGGFGPLLAVTAFGAKQVLMWFQDSMGSIRAVQAECEDSGTGLALQIMSIAQIRRG